MASDMRAELVGDALSEAVGTRGGNVAGVVFHSDRGTQYTSNEFAELATATGYPSRWAAPECVETTPPPNRSSPR